MRKWCARILFFGLAALPGTVQAQYPTPGFYYPQPTAYPTPYPYYPQAQYPPQGYYYPQPAPRYVPNYPANWQGMPAPAPWTNAPRPVQAQQGEIGSSSRVYNAVPQTVPNSVIVSDPANPFPFSVPAQESEKAKPANPFPFSLPVQESEKAKPANPFLFSVPAPESEKTKPANPIPFSVPAQEIEKTKLVRPARKIPQSLPEMEPERQPSDEPPVPSPTPPVPAPKGTEKESIAAPVKSLPPELSLPTLSVAKKCQVMIFGEYLHWNVHGVDVPFAQAFDGIDPIFSVPRGPVGVVSTEFQAGVRVGGGVTLNETSSVVGTFTYFRTNSSSGIAAPDGQVLHNFLAFPNTANSAVDSLTSTAEYAIQLRMADIDYKCAFVNNDCLSLTFVAGARYANLTQDVLGTFQVTGTTTVDSHITFDGFGPRIGLEGKYRLKCGVYGYANGMADFLFGQFRGNYVERNVFTGLVGQTSVNANRPVPVLEFELGAGWQSPKGHVQISGGYYVGSWFNTMTTTSLAGAIGNVNFTTNGNNFRDTLVFDGLVLRFEFRY